MVEDIQGGGVVLDNDDILEDSSVENGNANALGHGHRVLCRLQRKVNYQLEDSGDEFEFGLDDDSNCNPIGKEDKPGHAPNIGALGPNALVKYDVDAPPRKEVQVVS